MASSPGDLSDLSGHRGTHLYKCFLSASLKSRAAEPGCSGRGRTHLLVAPTGRRAEEGDPRLLTPIGHTLERPPLASPSQPFSGSPALTLPTLDPSSQAGSLKIVRKHWLSNNQYVISPLPCADSRPLKPRLIPAGKYLTVPAPWITHR